MAFKYDLTCSHFPDTRYCRRRLQVRSCVHKTDTGKLHSRTETEHIHRSSPCFPRARFSLDGLSKSSFRAFCPNKAPDRRGRGAIYKSRSNRILSNNNGLPFEVQIGWGEIKTLADVSTYDTRVIVYRLPKRCTDAHCLIKESSHPGVDPNCSHSPLDSSVVVELEAIEDINANTVTVTVVYSRPREVM